MEVFLVYVGDPELDMVVEALLAQEGSRIKLHVCVCVCGRVCLCVQTPSLDAQLHVLNILHKCVSNSLLP